MNKVLIVITILFCRYNSMAQATDTMYTMALKGVQINSRFANDTERYKFNQMRYYVTTILPYLDAATRLFNEINTRLADPELSKKDRRVFIKNKEDEMRDEFEDKVTSLNVTQGVLLVKLIARQTDVNIYRMLCDFKNPLVAIKWQAWAKLHGLNLDRMYHPEEEPRLELIMESLGYPLPASYAVNKN